MSVYFLYIIFICISVYVYLYMYICIYVYLYYYISSPNFFFFTDFLTDFHSYLLSCCNQITLINKEASGDIDFVVYEGSVPSWVSIDQMSGRLRPKEPFHMVLSFDAVAYHEAMQETPSGVLSPAPTLLPGISSSSSSSSALKGALLGGGSSSSSASLSGGVGKEFQPKLLRGSKSTSNVEGLLVIQYMAATSTGLESIVDTQGVITLADGTKELVLLQVDKLIIPIAYEVYHEV